MNLWFDFRYAWRLLMKSWGYSLMCASVVALSVGAAVWTYSVLYSQLLKPLGFPRSEHWYSLQIAAEATSRPVPSVDAYTYQELLKQTRSADHLGAYANRAVILSEGQASRTLRAAAITPRLLAATQVAPLLGRALHDTDAQAGAAAVGVLSFDTWRNYFAADPAIIGRTTRVDAAPVQIVGVMPKGFYELEDFELWMPLQIPPLARPGDSTMTLSPLIVLGENQNLDTVLNEMKPAIDRVNHDYPDLFKAERHAALIPGHLMFSHGSAPVVVMLSFMSAGVLLLGCVNISMVFLARLLERSRELALRVAVGSSRARLMRQCLLETAVIVVLGLLVGYGLAAMGIRWAQGIADFVTRISGSGVSANVPELRRIDFVAAMICAAAVWLLSTLIPAWRIAKQDAAAMLASGGKGPSIRGGNKSVGLLVGLQVVVSCLVLAVCANLILALRKEANKPSGLSTAHVMITTDPTVFDARYSTPADRLRYWENLSAAIASKIPGAEVAFTTAVPTQPDSVPVLIETQQGSEKQGTLTLPLTAVSDDYFNVLGLRLRSGRLFDSTDNSSSLNVAIVDENMAARYWPDHDVLGKRVRLSPKDDGPWLTIVGVASPVIDGPYRANMGVLYRPLLQAVPSEFRLLAKSANTASDSRDALRAAAFAVDRDLPLHNLQSLDDYMASLRITSTQLIPVMIAVALITALLAASGLFGLISRSVAQRTQEVGIRRALGATPRRAISMFTRQGILYLIVAIVGVGLGTMLMAPLSKAIHNIFDYVILGTTGVVLVMALVIFFATYFPSRHALALEPGDALRYE
jgi:predicted permease